MAELPKGLNTFQMSPGELSKAEAHYPKSGLNTLPQGAFHKQYLHIHSAYNICLFHLQENWNPNKGKKSSVEL